MDLEKIKRELDVLDSLERRVKSLVNPSAVMLRHIESRRQELLNPVEPSKEARK